MMKSDRTAGDEPFDRPSGGAPPVVRMRHITKRFGPVTVLDDVSLDFYPGEVHVLAGENGAGKSTLIKILAGVHSEYEGEVEVAAAPVQFKCPLDAAAHGIAVIHQEFSLIGSMSIADNLFLGRQPTRLGFVRDRLQREEIGQWLTQLGLEIDPQRMVGEFPVATQQLIEIAKALRQRAKIIVMDEPTSALNGPEVERLIELIDRLTGEGCAIVYISHKMEEIQRIADRTTVLRDGELVGTELAEKLPIPELIKWMVGRDVGESQRRQPASPAGAPPRLVVENLGASPTPGSGAPPLRDISFQVAPGEVVGVGGLEGSGASDLFLTLFGAEKGSTGTVLVDGAQVVINSPRQAIDAGVMLLPSDRRLTGLVLPLSVAANVTLASLGRVSSLGWRSPGRERRVAEEAVAALGVRAATLEQPVETLSGGNQQKVAIAKCLETMPRVMLLDEPTRGIDIGAKRAIYKLLDEWAAQGMAILLITSELPELLALSDRILVMHRGRITAQLTGAEATAEQVLAAAMGMSESD